MTPTLPARGRDADRRAIIEALLAKFPDPLGHASTHRSQLLELTPREVRFMLASRRFYHSLPSVVRNALSPCSVAGCSQRRDLSSEFCISHRDHDFLHGDPVRKGILFSKMEPLRDEVRAFLAANASHDGIRIAAAQAMGWLASPNLIRGGKKESTDDAITDYLIRARLAHLKASDLLCTIAGRFLWAMRHEIEKEPLTDMADRLTRFGQTEIGRCVLAMLPRGSRLASTGPLRRAIASKLPERAVVGCLRLAEAVEKNRRAERQFSAVDLWATPMVSPTLGIKLFDDIETRIE